MVNFLNELIQGDCLEVMKGIPDKSVDMIFADLPYGTTALEYDKKVMSETGKQLTAALKDLKLEGHLTQKLREALKLVTYTPIDLYKLWEQYERIIKDNGAILLFAAQPFTTALVASNPKLFRYEIIWEKTMATLFQHANRRPMLQHETILVFYKKQPTYNPQKTPGTPYKRKEGSGNRKAGGFHNNDILKAAIDNKGTRYPTTIVKYSNGNHNRLTKTEKPIPLLENYIKTYTNPGDVVLDNTAGAGGVGVAAINTGRHYILIEKNAATAALAAESLKQAKEGGTINGGNG